MQSGLDTGTLYFFMSSHFFIFIQKKINKSLSQIMFMVIYYWYELIIKQEEIRKVGRAQLQLLQHGFENSKF